MYIFKRLKAGKPGGSQDGCTRSQDCCCPACLQCSSPRCRTSCRRVQHGQHPTRPLIISIPFFSQKIFEPLTRLLSAVSSLLQKMYCTASTHLCFGRCAVTGGLRCALHCLPAYAQMRELKGTKPGGNQEC